MNPTARNRLLAVLGCIFLSVVVYFHQSIFRFFEPSPAPYSQQLAEHFDNWMRHDLSRFIIDTSHCGPDGFAPIAENLISATSFHRSLQRRAQELVDAVQAFEDYANGKGALAQRHSIQGQLDDIGASLARITQTLELIGAPYNIDYQVRARSVKMRWQLQLIIRSSKMLGLSTYAAEGQEFKIMRVDRIDNLDVQDLAHGLAHDGIASVLLEQIQQMVVHRYLPLLDEQPKLRDIFAEEKKADILAIGYRQLLFDVIPKNQHKAARLLGRFAAERRRVLEELNDTIARFGARLDPPSDLFIPASQAGRYIKWIESENKPDLATALRQISTQTDADAELLAAFRQVEKHLVELCLRSVERHEAWHLANADPQFRPGVHFAAESAGEMLAYLGAYADAEDGLIFEDDQLYRMFRLSKNQQSRSAVAIRNIVIEMIRFENANEQRIEELAKSKARDKPNDVFAQLANKQRIAQQLKREHAKELMRDWFGERRSLKRISYEDHSTPQP